MQSQNIRGSSCIADPTVPPEPHTDCVLLLPSYSVDPAVTGALGPPGLGPGPGGERGGQGPLNLEFRTCLFLHKSILLSHEGLMKICETSCLPCAYLVQGGCITQIVLRISIISGRPCALKILCTPRHVSRQKKNIYIYIYTYVCTVRMKR